MSFSPKNYRKTIHKLVCSIKRGETQKMDDLFEMTFNHFYGYALVRIWDKSKAEDAVMATYERVLRYINTFDTRQDGMVWIHRILHNTVYKMNADEKQKEKYERRIAYDEEKDEVYTIAGESDINGMYESLGLSQAVAEMDETDRRIAYLLFFERLTLEEISKELNLSRSAIHYRKERIIKNFKKYLF